MTDALGSGPLDGVRVVDLTRILAGPFCTMMLGDMGADVIKVEQPGKGDDTRAWGPPFADEESAYYLGVNRNKRGMTLNLKAPRGLDILKQLLADADVLVENFKLGTLDGWGLDDAWFRAHAPRVVRCSIMGYGSSGPKAGMPGYDFLLQAESGLMSITGEPDGAPMKLGVAIVDLCTGMYASSGILAALHARDRTGEGQCVEVSLYDTGVSLLANVASNFLISGEQAARYGNGHPNIVPYNAYAARDAMIALSVGNDGQFRKFADLAGRPGWADDPRFARNRDRVANREELDRLINDVLGSRDADDWLADFHRTGIAASRINTAAEALTADHTLARDLVRTVTHSTAGEISVPGIPFRFSDDQATIRRPPPSLGEHTEDVLQRQLGFTGEEIAALRAEGVI